METHANRRAVSSVLLRHLQACFVHLQNCVLLLSDTIIYKLYNPVSERRCCNDLRDVITLL